MSCPVCTGSYIPDNVSVINRKGERVILQGKIYAIIRSNDAHYSPFSDYCTVSIYPLKGKGKVKYLKFKTENELEKWNFTRENKIRCEGCHHEIDNKEIVFDITNVEFL